MCLIRYNLCIYVHDFLNLLNICFNHTTTVYFIDLWISKSYNYNFADIDFTADLLIDHFLIDSKVKILDQIHTDYHKIQIMDVVLNLYSQT